MYDILLLDPFESEHNALIGDLKGFVLQWGQRVELDKYDAFSRWVVGGPHISTLTVDEVCYMNQPDDKRVRQYTAVLV